MDHRIFRAVNLFYVIVVVGLLTVTPWTVALQAPLSMKFSRQECWSGAPFPSPEDRPNSGIEPRSPALQADILPLSHQRYYNINHGLEMIMLRQ